MTKSTGRTAENSFILFYLLRIIMIRGIGRRFRELRAFCEGKIKFAKIKLAKLKFELFFRAAKPNHLK